MDKIFFTLLPGCYGSHEEAERAAAVLSEQPTQLERAEWVRPIVDEPTQVINISLVERKMRDHFSYSK